MIRTAVTVVRLAGPLVLALLFGAAPIPAAPGARSATRDEITRTKAAELRALDPRAAELFEQASAASDPEAASRLFAESLALVPGNDVALRRRSHAELQLDRRDAALPLARQALEIERSAPNLLAVARALEGPGAEPSPDEIAEARTLAAEAAGIDHGSPDANVILARLAVRSGDIGAARDHVTAALRADPADPEALYLRAGVSAAEGDLRRALKEIGMARDGGVPEEACAEMESRIRAAMPWWMRIAPWAAVVGAAWAIGFIVLFVAGLILSRIALRVANQPPSPGGMHVIPPRVRRAYNAVVGAACAYYYVSLPLVLALVAVFAGGIFLAFSYAGSIPVKLVVVLALMVLVTGYAIVRSIFVRVRDEDPGERVDLAHHPRLAAEVRDVAARIGTPVVDQVFLTPDANIAVFERGGILRKARGSATRCLILGTGALDGLKLPAFRAVLGHEYGHLTNRDTAGGSLALLVRRHLHGVAQRLGETGFATWWNPAWLFLNGYFRMFVRITHGASRLQEFMADRWAVAAYGSQAFQDGLTHVIRRSLVLDRTLHAAVQSMETTREPVTNLYSMAGVRALAFHEVEAELRSHVDAPASPYDSHPSPADRFRLAQAMNVPVPETPDAGLDAWSLFEGREDIERRMTQRVFAGAE